MNSISKQILDTYQVRKTKKQKEAFRKFICDELSKEGYKVKEDKKGSSTNIIIGDENNSKIICTAHYDTCAMLPFPNLIVPNNLFGFILSQLFVFIMMILVSTVLGIMLYPFFEIIGIEIFTYSITIFIFLIWMFYGVANKHTANDNTSGVITIIEAALKMPHENRSEICFILFDNEEIGLVGSSSFAKKNKNIKLAKLVLNFDCVSDGDNIFFFPSKQMKKNTKINDLIINSFISSNNKNISINNGFGIYPSDNLSFKKSYGICALKKGVFYYMNRIHTLRDTIFDEKNIDILSTGICNITKKLQ